MSRITRLFACVLGIELVAVCAAAAAGTAPTTTATGAVASEYLFRGLRRNGASFQPGVETETGPLTLGAWGNFPFHHKVAGSSDPEIDLYGQYAFPLTSAANIVPGATLYWYPDTANNDQHNRATFEPSVALNFTHASGVRLTPKIYYDTVLKGATFEVAAAYAYPVSQWGTELDFMATAGTYRWRDYANKSPTDVKAWGDYWLLGVGAPFQFGRNQKIAVNFAYTEGRDAFTKRGTAPRAVNPLAAGRGVLTLTYSYTF